MMLRESGGPNNQINSLISGVVGGSLNIAPNTSAHTQGIESTPGGSQAVMSGKHSKVSCHHLKDA